MHEQGRSLVVGTAGSVVAACPPPPPEQMSNLAGRSNGKLRANDLPSLPSWVKQMQAKAYEDVSVDGCYKAKGRRSW